MDAPAEPLRIDITYDGDRVRGVLRAVGDPNASSIWERLSAKLASNPEARFTSESFDLPWPDVLGVVREFGSGEAQRRHHYRLKPIGKAADMVRRFIAETKSAQTSRGGLVARIEADDVQDLLTAKGFERDLRPFQRRDLSHLLSLPHGANFSVPGAGKTTVTLALHLLAAECGEHLLVVAPKTAFAAWRTIVDECMSPEASQEAREPFWVLDGSEWQNDEALRSGRKRFVISYDLLVRQQSTIANYLARQPVHLVLDESHRMKAGTASRRGAFLISVSALPARRDILSGTPMPQDAGDMASQLKFLWPGGGRDTQIERGVSPRTVLGALYVRTTKTELGLPPAKRHFYDVPMAESQLALYGVVKNEILRQITSAISGSGPDYIAARRSVMRLLQLSSNPLLAVQAMSRDRSDIASGIVEKVVEEGTSLKMQDVCSHTRRLSSAGEKVVIWTIFTQSILDLELLLADLNPVSLYGAVPSGEANDPSTREGRLARFHREDTCRVLIANPAAAGEGISLHTVCHNAIYLDRSYVSTHYLQSIDRIHRLGLRPGQRTDIHIYRTRAPAELGSIDMSVSRRLARKIRNLQTLLDDPDLHSLAFDEENADDPLDYDVTIQDLMDLVAELEGRQEPGAEEA